MEPKSPGAARRQSGGAAAHPEFHSVVICRVCRSEDLERVLDLGRMPLANALLPELGLVGEEPTFPLELLLCRSCGLAQLSIVVDPTIMFGHYVYASSSSAPMVEHFAAYAREVSGRFAPTGSLVVEIGSNDGVLLRALARHDLRVLGIEPSDLAATANASGLETWNVFFSEDVAREVVRLRGRASLILANNVLAHIDALEDVMRGLEALLDEDGVFVAEFPYVQDLLDHVEYDTIYHEHLSYFAVRPIERLLSESDLEPFDVQRLAVHGGSLRLFVARRRRRQRTAALEKLREEEETAGLFELEAYRRFAQRVNRSRISLLDLIDRERSAGSRLAALGASAKGNTLLNYCGIGPDRIPWIGDSTPIKIGLYTPGTHIPIRAERTVRKEHPDRVLLLAWNYADAIVRRYQDYIADGGRFIHPLPVARLIP